MRVSEAFENYRLEVISFRNQSRKTEEHHTCALKCLLKFTGDIEIEDLDFETVRKWKLKLDKEKGAESVRGYLIKLRVVLAHLQKQGVNCLDPDLIPLPKRMEKTPVFITKEEVAHLIDCTGRVKNKAIISLLYSSGLRISELCSLNTDSIKDHSFTIVGKGGRQRLCFTDDRTLNLISEYQNSRRDNKSPLFLTEAGLRITPCTIQDTFKSSRKKANLPNVHPHTLRHSYATDLMNNGCHIYVLSRLLGHKSIATTSVYLHVSDPHLEADYNKYHKT